MEELTRLIPQMIPSNSNANITIADGTYTLATGDDGVHADDALIVNGGTITVTESYEGLEGLAVTINDGND